MKKTLLTLAVSAFTLATLRADLIWYEGWNYPDGHTTNVSGGLWEIHSGDTDSSFITGNRLEISGNSSTNAPRTGDVHRDFCTTACSYTNGVQQVYASFTVNCTNLPTSVANYFAHFYVSNTNFQGRVFSTQGSLPGTWKLGVSAASGSPNQFFPADLAPDTDYQVVLGWDPVSLYSATLWVNPVSQFDTSVATSDPVTATEASTAFAFRQAAGNTSFFAVITNLAVATTFDEAANAVWNPAPVAPAIVKQPEGGTNFSGSDVTLFAIAAGQGQGSLTYQWRKNGTDVGNPNGNTNVFTLFGATAGDSGDYDVVVTTPNALSVTSVVATLWVTNPPVPPTITSHPVDTTVYFGQNVMLTVEAIGPGTITYQWNKGGSPLPGEVNSTLAIMNVQTNNGTTGVYSCGVTNEFGGVLSSNAVVAAIPAPAVSIGFLRTLVDPVSFLPTNTTSLWSATGIVTTHTNVTTSGNASFYMEDGTGGMNVFYGGGSDVRPAAGDSVTVVGPLAHFNGLLELALSISDPAHSVVTNSSGNLLPPGYVLPFSFTNSPDFGGVGEAIRKYQSSVVTFTNVYFAAAGGTFAGGVNYVITNQAGEPFAFRIDTRVGDIINKPIPSHAWTVRGVMGYFNPSNPDRSVGHQLLPTRYADIVTDAPPAVTSEIALSGNEPLITWTAQPFMSYSILRATNVTGPYVPLISGLTFNTTAGQFADTNTSPSTRFYRIISP